MIQKKIIGILGVWVIVSTILLRSTEANTLNIIVIGVISAISGMTLTLKKSFESWVGAILGLWLIISAFIPSLERVPCKYCNAFAIGITFVVIGFIKFRKKEDPFEPYDNYHNKIHIN
ncbi:hypothetical protein ABRY23_00910 [Melioribacteraceae bacterium 4301-Me]|uniref:SPW repeat domain-containing protein n=1 Tax=Pyranulibacter aquaticus TaxID=3163344 RepID=UPI003595DB71